jgi:DNA primase
LNIVLDFKITGNKIDIFESMPLSEITIAKIKEAVDIIDVIGDYVQLKKKGQNWWALSPFTQEKTPSFSVSPAKGIFKDFSSGKGGDAISFIMELDGLNYIEALKVLAKKYSIEIEEVEGEEDRQLASERESLHIVSNYAREFYSKHLKESEEGKIVGLPYLKERGILQSTIDSFELGLAPSGWDSFYQALKKGRYNLDFAEKSGLIIKKEEKVYDRFRERLIFPIHNLSGKVIGFGGRVLKEQKNQPKYLNSPESPIYHKGLILYGMYHAKQSIRQLDECILVEGYTDVLSFFQAGITNVVSSSGTALTSDQIKLIGRFSKNITLLYDGDEAGLKAAARGLDLILEAGYDPRVVVFPDKMDPDDFLRKKGFEETKKILKGKKDFIDFLSERLLDGAGNDPLRRAGAVKEIVGRIAKVPDLIKKNFYFKQCSDKFGIEEKLLINEHNKIQFTERKFQQRTRITPLVEPHLIEDQEKNYQKEPEELLGPMEGEILKTMVLFGNVEIDDHGKLAAYILENISEVEFSNGSYRELLDLYKSLDREKGYPELEDFLEDEGLKSFKELIIDLTSEKYDVSPNWKAHQIHIPTMEEILGEKLSTDIYRLKWRKLKTLIRENQNQIKILQEDKKEEAYEEVLKLLRQQKALKKIERDIANDLGNVIST